MRFLKKSAEARGVSKEITIDFNGKDDINLA
jgi:hypothetical protein